MRILLVEDHADTATVLARLLRRDGHDVNTAATADDALAACDARNVDLLICDIGLPEHDGWELLPRVRERHAVPAVALTGYGTPADVARSRAAGYDLHLTKPIDLAALRAAVAKFAPACATPAPAAAPPALAAAPP
jgi:CheY-like chemotaxis protein